ASTEQAYTAFLSSITVQAPQSPRSQTRFGPVTSNLSRNASRSVTRDSRFALNFLPLTSRVTGTFPGPKTWTSSPATSRTVGPRTGGADVVRADILRNVRREITGALALS